MSEKVTRILCFGDSNTYGHNPENGLRYSKDERWPGVLNNLLGEGYQVIEEGCNGRTTILKDSLDAIHTGKDYIKTCLKQHAPIDVVILMLGTNDLKLRFGLTVKQIAEGEGEFTDLIKAVALEIQGYEPKIVLVSPPLIGEDILSSRFGPDFGYEAVAKSKEFSGEYKRVAEEKNLIFFDAATVAMTSKFDSVHLTKDAHRSLATALKEYVNQ